jgi:hypothetical protein
MKIKFDYGLFYHAMIGLLGRDPDRCVRLGMDGFYHFKYIPTGEVEVKLFSEHVVTLGRWLDLFEIIFSESRCEYGRARMSESGDPDVLEVIIKHLPRP